MISTNRPLFALTLRFALGIACCATALPQPAITQQSASKTTLITLGTQGGPFQSRNRAQPANVLIVNRLTSLRREMLRFGSSASRAYRSHA
jgi:hypothetical protein